MDSDKGIGGGDVKQLREGSDDDASGGIGGQGCCAGMGSSLIQVQTTGAPRVESVHRDTQPAAVRGRRLPGRLVHLPAQTRQDDIGAASVRRYRHSAWCGTVTSMWPEMQLRHGSDM